MKRKLRIISAIILSIVCVSVGAAAEPADMAPKHFYEQDYAKQPGSENLLQEVPKTNEAKKDSGDSSTQESSPELPSPEEQELSGLKATALGILVSGEGTEKTRDNLLALKDLAVRLKVPVSEVSLVAGFGSKVTGDALAALLEMGAQIQMLSTPDQAYPVKQSPTWIVETAQGKILLEGIDSIERYFNSRGEFVERAGPALGEASSPP